MKATVRRIGVSLGAAVIAATLLVPVATAQAAAPGGSVAAAPAAAYTWYWSDGETSTRRKFSQYNYGSAANLPYLIVEASCGDGARVGDTIKLQFRDSYGKYITEDSHYVSSCNGSYDFTFYPYTTSGKWARGTYKYRLIVPGGVGYQYFEITYSKR